MKTFPMLYSKSSTGAIVEWQIRVDGATITTEWGKRGGKKQTGEDTIKKGKNLGRSNATTPEQQAELEAEAKWTKQLKKDYVKTVEAAEAGASSDLVTGGVLPMLAHKYSEKADKIVWPAYSQPKFDGHRCLAIVDNEGKCTLWSRTRKPMYCADHVIKAIEALGVKDIIFDGEGYNHEYRDKFEQLTHFLRQPATIAGSEIVQYHIYDIVDTMVPFEERTAKLEDIIKKVPSEYLHLAETKVVADEDELMLAFEEFLKQGYEGAMVRNGSGLYAINKRSNDLQKVKEFDEAEFPVVGVNEGRGKLAGHAIFVCQTKEGKTFPAKQKGEQSALKKYFDNPKLCIGRQMTVKFQGFTTKNKVPRFGVALRFREDI